VLVFWLEGVECFDVGATHHRVEGNQAQPEEHGVMHFDITSEFVTRSVLLTLKIGPPWRNARDTILIQHPGLRIKDTSTRRMLVVRNLLSVSIARSFLSRHKTLQQ
jgi:hypothetical protein